MKSTRPTLKLLKKRGIDSLNVPEIQFEEEFWVDENQQGYWRRSRNVTLDNLFQIWQASTCSKDRNNNEWTYSEEEGSVEVFTKDKLAAALENVLGKFIEKTIQDNINKTENILDEKFEKVTEPI